MQPRMALRKWSLAAAAIVGLCLPGILRLGIASHFARADGGAEPLPVQVNRDFRGRPLPPDIVPYGPQTDAFIKVQAEGLRITLPRDRPGRPPLGLTMPLTVAGDFEITTTLEILEADEPDPDTRTYGVGVLLSLNQAARIGRLSRAQGKQVVTWDRWGEVAGKRKFLVGDAPCSDKGVRLRLKRVGTNLDFLWAPEGAGDRFTSIHQCEFGADDITELRWELNPQLGDRPALLDFRLVDLTVRSGNLTANPVPATEEKNSSGGWLVLAALLAFVILSSLAAWAVVRHRRPKERPAVATGQEENEEPTTALPQVSFPCSGCGRNLKAKAALAGQKVKCSQCGKVVLVPASG
jgi:hypothetical protein